MVKSVGLCLSDQGLVAEIGNKHEMVVQTFLSYKSSNQRLLQIDENSPNWMVAWPNLNLSETRFLMPRKT